MRGAMPNPYPMLVRLALILFGLSLTLGLAMNVYAQSPNPPVPPPHYPPTCQPKQILCVKPATPQFAPGHYFLRDAAPSETWITAPTLGASSMPVPSPKSPRHISVDDTTPPTDPTNLVAHTNGLFSISATWDPATDPESGIAYYVFAIGSGTTPETTADLRWWQVLYGNTLASVSMALTEGQTYYLTIQAVNGANLYSNPIHSAPMVAMHQIFGQPTNHIHYVFAENGLDANGGITATWSSTQVSETTNFLDKMLPVIYDLYGPPSVDYTVTLVRNLSKKGTAIFYPSTDDIHMGDTATYQLLTHEFIHAWRNDRILASNSQWDYDATFSGFEEGFAQAVSYDAMTEFARRFPDFGLTQMVYQSGNEWDYDFQNVPELGNTDYWSDTSGMNLYWTRYEMGAAAISKIQIEHPGFYKSFNAEYYQRLNDHPTITLTRPLIKEIIATVAPVIEGRPTGEWIDHQYIFDCAVHPGLKIWPFLQHYPTGGEYYIFNAYHFYNTFPNGSDWSFWNGTDWTMYSQNGSTGYATVQDANHTTLWQNTMLISPTQNPPVLYQYGIDEVHLTTGAQAWPNVDASKYVTGLTILGLYSINTQFISGTATLTNTAYRVMGQELRNATGVFGGILGANGGQIHIDHQGYAPEPAALVINGGFWMTRTWASLDHPTTSSVDTVPGQVNFTYIDQAGKVYTDTRTIGFGNFKGNQVFFLNVAQMHQVVMPINYYRLYLPLLYR